MCEVFSELGYALVLFFSNTKNLGVAELDNAFALGAKDREFKSHHPDQEGTAVFRKPRLSWSMRVG